MPKYIYYRNPKFANNEKKRLIQPKLQREKSTYLTPAFILTALTLCPIIKKMDDLKEMKETGHDDSPGGGLKRIRSRFFLEAARFLGLWTGVFALSGGTVCPFCGQPGCPTGLAGAGILGGLVSAIIFIPRWVRARIRPKEAQELPESERCHHAHVHDGQGR